MNKDHLIPIIEQIIKLSTYATQQGILGLSEILSETYDPLLVYGLGWVIDGLDPAQLQIILERLTDADATTPEDKLKAQIITEGVLSIQVGMHTDIIRHKLYAYLGLAYVKQIEQNTLAEKEQHAQQFYGTLVQREITSPDFDQQVLSWSSEQIQMILRQDISFHDVACALTGCGVPAVKKMLAHLAPNIGYQVTDVLNHWPADATTAQTAQNKISEIAARFHS